uniref:Uncharacterized protein n=1 Tax=Rhizophora mucronata TaxID=61149 RepID=A0A2P2N502_RHIMU
MSLKGEKMNSNQFKQNFISLLQNLSSHAYASNINNKHNNLHETLVNKSFLNFPL